MRLAIGDAAGLTIKAQIRCATVNLGYGADAWRVREALYGRAGSWSPSALDDLRRRFAAWQAYERASTAVLPSRPTLPQRLDAIRATLAALASQVGELALEVATAADDER